MHNLGVILRWTINDQVERPSDILVLSTLCPEISKILLESWLS